MDLDKRNSDGSSFWDSNSFFYATEFQVPQSLSYTETLLRFDTCNVSGLGNAISDTRLWLYAKSRSTGEYTYLEQRDDYCGLHSTIEIYTIARCNPSHLNGSKSWLAAVDLASIVAVVSSFSWSSSSFGQFRLTLTRVE